MPPCLKITPPGHKPTNKQTTIVLGEFSFVFMGTQVQNYYSMSKFREHSSGAKCLPGTVLSNFTSARVPNKTYNYQSRYRSQVGGNAMSQGPLVKPTLDGSLRAKHFDLQELGASKRKS